MAMITIEADGRSRVTGATLIAFAGVACAGAMVTFPVLIPGGGSGLRVTELLNGAAAVALLVALISGMPIHRIMIPLLAAAALSLFWIANELIAVSLNLGSLPARMILVRWLMSIPTAYWIGSFMSNGRYRPILVTGMLVGLALSIGSVCFDYLFFDPAAVVLDPFAEEDVVYLGDVRRAQGIFSHPNAAAGTVLLAVPLIIGLIEEGYARRVTILAAMALIVITFITTETRGPTTVAAAMVLWHLIGHARKGAGIIAIIFLVGAAGFSIVQGNGLSNQDLVARMSDTESGAKDRQMTTEASLAIAVDHPLGVGSQYEVMLEKTTGFRATHDGWAQLVMLAGWPLTLFVGIRCFGHARGLFQRKRSIECWIAFFMIGAFMFENQFFVPTFSALSLWLLYSPEVRPDQSGIGIGT